VTFAEPSVAAEKSESKASVVEKDSKKTLPAASASAPKAETKSKTEADTGTVASANSDAEEGATHAEPLTESLPTHPYELVKVMTDRLLKKLEHFQTLETEAEKEAFARSVVDETFAAMVDFELIARRVMAKHYNYASPEQREQFAKTFRESLINTYAMGMAAYSDQKIIIDPFGGIKDGKRKRAKVTMQIHATDGEIYPIEYALYENKEGNWMLENITLNGVNLGLTFRNQFNESLRANKGNIDAVIENWNAELSELDS
jgi:phospholipid transport system substrate-binding protein